MFFIQCNFFIIHFNSSKHRKYLTEKSVMYLSISIKSLTLFIEKTQFINEVEA